MTADELSAQLWGGKTLSDIATVKAAQIAETKTAINQAVTAGTVTQAKADWLIQGLDKGYWGPGAQGDFGFGMGPGFGHGGPRGFGGPMGAIPQGSAPSGIAPNSTTPNSNGTVTPNGTSF